MNASISQFKRTICELSGGVTDTREFSLYVSPYMSVNSGGRYTKHFYAGITVDYQAKKAALEKVLAERFEELAVPYSGEDNDNYTETIVGNILAGRGKPYDIHIYGEQKLKSKKP